MPNEDAKPSLLQEKLAETEATIAQSMTISVGDVFAGRTVVGVRTVDGDLFVSFGGNVWEPA
jgi:hypothetical protein